MDYGGGGEVFSNRLHTWEPHKENDANSMTIEVRGERQRDVKATIDIKRGMGESYWSEADWGYNPLEKYTRGMKRLGNLV